MSGHLLSEAIKRNDVQLELKFDMSYLSYSILNKFEELKCLTTLRLAESDFLRQDSSVELLEKIGPRTAKVLEIPFKNFFAGEQIHKNNVFCIGKDEIDSSQNFKIIPRIDALITSQKHVPLIIFTADCLPLFLYDKRNSAIGIVHIGKAGTELDVLGNTLKSMAKNFGSRPYDMVAVIGPSVGPCHYPVDLWERNEKTLSRIGVGLVFNTKICTICNLSQFYSYRAEKGLTGRMLSAIMLT